MKGKERIVTGKWRYKFMTATTNTEDPVHNSWKKDKKMTFMKGRTMREQRWRSLDEAVPLLQDTQCRDQRGGGVVEWRSWGGERLSKRRTLFKDFGRALPWPKMWPYAFYHLWTICCRIYILQPHGGAGEGKTYMEQVINEIRIGSSYPCCSKPRATDGTTRRRWKELHKTGRRGQGWKYARLLHHHHSTLWPSSLLLSLSRCRCLFMPSEQTHSPPAMHPTTSTLSTSYPATYMTLLLWALEGVMH